jgi:predicted SAM-dependent methyltransferase
MLLGIFFKKSLKFNKFRGIFMKLHLGCEQKHLKGYVNIDFLISEHGVQEMSMAEIQTDITKLSYPPSTIDEIRFHHVFEHFTRPIACAHIVVWRNWLKPDGILHIEVPDFYKTSFIIIKFFWQFS